MGQRRAERRGEDSGSEGRDARQSSTAIECEAAATKAAIDARQRSERGERIHEGRKGGKTRARARFNTKKTEREEWRLRPKCTHQRRGILITSE